MVLIIAKITDGCPMNGKCLGQFVEETELFGAVDLEVDKSGHQLVFLSN